MSGKKPSVLRSALKEMRVNEPVRLSKSAPSFKPPQEAPSVSGNEAPLREVPPSEVPSLEATHNEQPANEDARKELAQREGPQTEAAQNKATQSKQPRIENARVEVLHIELPQIEVTQPDHTQNEQARNEAPREKLPKKEAPRSEQPSGSFFRLSDRAFSYPVLQKLSGDCLRLFLWMSSRGWRYQNSDGSLRASVGFIEDNTAMSHATISRCLKTLRQGRLIDLLEMDYKRGNVWSVSPVAFAGCDPENLPPRFGGPQNEALRNESSPASKRDDSHLSLREKPPQFEGQVRKIKKDKKLSQEGAEKLFERIEAIRAPEKQRSEREGLIQLLEKYQPTELENALAYVERYGTLSGEKCHSPFRYLLVAVDDVLRTCGKTSFRIAAKLSAQQVESASRDVEQEAEKNRKALDAFRTEVNDEERSKFIDAYTAKEFSWGFKPSSDLIVRLAAIQWFAERQLLQNAVG
jgi:hypothetical protein